MSSLTRTGQWLVVAVLSLHILFSNRTGAVKKDATPLKSSPLAPAVAKQAQAKTPLDPAYLINDPPGYQIGPPQIWLHPLRLAYNLTMLDTKLEHDPGLTEAADATSGASQYNLRIRSILHVLEGPLPLVDGSTIKARCRFKTADMYNGRQRQRFYMPDARVTIGRIDSAQGDEATEVPLDITCSVPIALESRLDNLGAVYFNLRLEVGKLLTDTVKGEEIDSTVTFSLDPMKLDIQT